jgi:HIV Tat-specific factor 1
MITPEDSVNAINKNSRVVVLKHMFTLEELEEDTALLLDLKEDVRDECASLGDVTNVVLYDVSPHSSSAIYSLTVSQKEPDGVMTVKFRDPISAQACVLVNPGRLTQSLPSHAIYLIQKMNGRFFAGSRIEATLYSGKHRFRRSGTGEEVEGEGDETEKKRLDDFAQWLLTEGD